MREGKKFKTFDVWLSAYLQVYYTSPELQLINSKVVFSFPHSDDLYKFLANYNGNVNVPIADYVATVKTLRGQMLSMRGGQK